MGEIGSKADPGSDEDKSLSESVSEMLQGIADERELPRELPSIKSEYQKFCETDGPVELLGFPKKVRAYRACCRDFPQARIIPIIDRWQKDAAIGRRHWLAMALVVANYKFAREEFDRIGKAPSPAEISQLLSRIAAAAEELTSSLNKLQELSFQISDGSSPKAIGHLRWIDQYLAQAAAGVYLSEVNETPEIIATVQTDRTIFVQRIIGIHAASSLAARKLLDVELLRHRKGGSNPALKKLVTGAARIWESLTNRPASTNKVSNKEREEPDFVIFVQTLAKVAGGNTPTFKQIATAFRPPRTPD
jgi:hypothetical protein